MTDLPADQRTAHESVPDEAHVGRFSGGLELQPSSPQKLHRGRFSEGLEQRPESPRKRRVGRFSDGVDHDVVLRPEHLRGSFAGLDRAHPGAA
jgi:hypothetical protein